MFVGDLLHSPVQVLRPHAACALDPDAAQARSSWRRVLERAARSGSHVLPAHLAGSGALVPVTHGDPGGDESFDIPEWSRLPVL